jgi:hypothetical protein
MVAESLQVISGVAVAGIAPCLSGGTSHNNRTNFNVVSNHYLSAPLHALICLAGTDQSGNESTRCIKSVIFASLGQRPSLK